MPEQKEHADEICLFCDAGGAAHDPRCPCTLSDVNERNQASEQFDDGYADAVKAEEKRLHANSPAYQLGLEIGLRDIEDCPYMYIADGDFG